MGKEGWIGACLLGTNCEDGEGTFQGSGCNALKSPVATRR